MASGRGGAVLALLVALALSASALEDSVRDSMLIIGGGGKGAAASTTTTTTSRKLLQQQMSGEPEPLMKWLVDKHNELRGRHGVPALTWDWALAWNAYNYVADCPKGHSGVQGIGENLAWGHNNFNHAMRDWYDEIQFYNFGAPGFAENTGHFSQLIWADSSKIGCAANLRCSFKTWICQFTTAGNLINYDGSADRALWTTNVPAPGAQYVTGTRPDGAPAYTLYDPTGESTRGLPQPRYGELKNFGYVPKPGQTVVLTDWQKFIPASVLQAHLPFDVLQRYLPPEVLALLLPERAAVPKPGSPATTAPLHEEPERTIVGWQQLIPAAVLKRYIPAGELAKYTPDGAILAGGNETDASAAGAAPAAAAAAGTPTSTAVVNRGAAVSKPQGAPGLGGPSSGPSRKANEAGALDGLFGGGNDWSGNGDDEPSPARQQQQQQQYVPYQQPAGGGAAPQAAAGPQGVDPYYTPALYTPPGAPAGYQPYVPTTAAVPLPGTELQPQQPAAQPGAAQQPAVMLSPAMQDALDVHNHYRRRHQAPPLAWDPALQASAVAAAKACPTAPSGTPGVGENIGWGFTSPAAATDQWYAEGAKYNFGSPGFDTATGYFTQIVWQDTQRLGCAQVLSGCSMNPIICHYFPPGNVAGRDWAQEVKPAVALAEPPPARRQPVAAVPRPFGYQPVPSYPPQPQPFQQPAVQASNIPPVAAVPRPLDPVQAQPQPAPGQQAYKTVTTTTTYYSAQAAAQAGEAGPAASQPQAASATPQPTTAAVEKPLARGTFVGADRKGKEAGSRVAASRPAPAAVVRPPVDVPRAQFARVGTPIARQKREAVAQAVPKLAPSRPATAAVLSPELQAALDRHNERRSAHQAPALAWDATIAASAATWAAGCPNGHSGAPGLGENMAWGFASLSAAVDAWYEEVSLYAFAKPGWSPATGHFTQLVWASTTKVGCAVNKACAMATYVCQYSPAGNVMGVDWSQQVKPKTDLAADGATSSAPPPPPAGEAPQAEQPTGSDDTAGPAQQAAAPAASYGSSPASPRNSAGRSNQQQGWPQQQKQLQAQSAAQPQWARQQQRPAPQQLQASYPQEDTAAFLRPQPAQQSQWQQGTQPIRRPMGVTPVAELAPFTSAATAAADVSVPAEYAAVLQLTNALRAKHQAAGLTWDDKLASRAQQYAASCPGNWRHSGDKNVGEAIAWGYPSLESAVTAWTSEAATYDFANPGWSGATGHFTQLVWKGTTRMGCGSMDSCSASGDSTTFVCQFWPAGNNVNADWTANVVPAAAV